MLTGKIEKGGLNIFPLKVINRPPKPEPSNLSSQVSVKELIDCIPDLKVTKHQREFIKAAFRACLRASLQKKFNCIVEI